MKIYTRTGDSGTTGLFGGGRVAKNDPRIRAYGTVDETNSTIGLARAHLSASLSISGSHSVRLNDTLKRIQAELFVVGADLATPLDARASVPRVGTAHVTMLEEDIDRFDGELPDLRHFILPGGTLCSSTLHLARTTCRRAEREAVEAIASIELNPDTIVYLNRLSDLLFVLARWGNLAAGVEDTIWEPDK